MIDCDKLPKRVQRVIESCRGGAETLPLTPSERDRRNRNGLFLRTKRTAGASKIVNRCNPVGTPVAIGRRAARA